MGGLPRKKATFCPGCDSHCAHLSPPPPMKLCDLCKDLDVLGSVAQQIALLDQEYEENREDLVRLYEAIEASSRAPRYNGHNETCPHGAHEDQ